MDAVLRYSEFLDKIAPALIRAQGNMTEVLKESTNPAFRSKYADLGNCLDATLPALQAQGIAVIQGPGGDGVTILVETMLLHESGQFIASTLALKPTKADPQGAGSAITYARRYAVLAMCGKAPEDDDGAAASKAPKPLPEPEPKPKPKPAAVSPEHKQRVLAMTLFSNLRYTDEQRYDLYESVCGYNEAGEPCRSWADVVKWGKASIVIDALQAHDRESSE